ncbi:MAG: DUF2784 family protein [Chloroflexi bacterium]|nr:DUF2784 family protein [Chloroflexota bacterium]
METAYTFLANAVFALHLLIVLAVLPSTALFCLGAYRRRSFLRQIHCLGVYVMAVWQIVLRECPLVPLEGALREAGGEAPWYRGSFTLFVVEWTTGFHLPVVVITSLSVLIIALTTIAVLAPYVGAALSLARSNQTARR